MTEATTEAFGAALRRSRREAGLSLRELSVRVGYDFSYLSQVERGLRPGSDQLAELCDKALGTALAAVYQRDTGVARELGFFAEETDEHEWAEKAAAHARDVFTTAPNVLLSELSTDLQTLRRVLGQASRKIQSRLADPAVRLSIVMAVLLVASGRQREARSWWRTAHGMAARSGDAQAERLVTGWQAMTAFYSGRLPQIDSSTAVRAKSLAVMGRADEARQTLQVLAQLPTSDDWSLFGWTEYRLHHVESFVFTTLGDLLAAYDAQEQSMRLYPEELAAEKAMLELHRAMILTRIGELDGLGYAMRILIELPDHAHNEFLYDVAGRVLAVVPRQHLGRAVVRDYRELLVTRHHLRHIAGNQPRPAVVRG